MRRARPRWTLRRRLVVGIVALLAAASLVIGTVAVLALQSSLVTQLDNQLSTSSSRFQGVADGPNRPGQSDGGRPGPGDVLPVAGLLPGTVAAFVRSGSITSAVLDEQLGSTALTTAQNEVLLGLSTEPVPTSVDLGGDLGEYRVLVTDAGGGQYVVIGMSLASVDSTVRQLVIVIAMVTLVALLAAVLAGTAIVRVALRPLQRVVATASHVAELPLERGEVALAVRVPDEDSDPRTEVGQVGSAINRMLGHISAALTAREASERKVRTFVADASHELRTPLASIRGYAELTRRGGHELPDDVVHALARVESESVRMTSLVEDLLLLARLDDGRSLESSPVDLGQLLTDAVSDAYAAGPDHEWSLELPEEPVLVPGDAARLHQVVANLLTNARVHTPVGSDVTASVTVSADSAQITVRDDGPGIDPAVLETVFERFARGDSSRSRVAGSTGLGLAIVAAIVEAHGGTVWVDSVPGATSFTVSLPLAD